MIIPDQVLVECYSKYFGSCNSFKFEAVLFDGVCIYLVYAGDEATTSEELRIA